MVEKEQTRKIQFTGRSSYIVSLPKEWIMDQGIKQGDQVIVTRQGSSVLEIRPINFRRPTTQDAATLVITSKDDKHTITRKLIALYFLRYKTINVKPKNGRVDPNQRIAIRNTVKKILMGAEITADSTNEITIQVLINLVELSIDGAFKRMLHLSKSMQNDALLALKENNKELAQEVLNSDDDVDRFSFYIIRQLTIAIENSHMLEEMGFANARDCMGYRIVVKNIERLADHAVSLSQDILDFENPIPEKIINKIKDMSDFSLNVVDDTCLALFKNDYTGAEKAIGESHNISKYEKRVIDLLKTIKNEETIFRVRRIVENIRRISEYASDIGEVVLNMNVEKLIQR
jgi:phosphate uptake regulator|tara:strand:- start:4271 stop:5308 length:1038 start_codon:yes stop_codon:yes gene_type:complete